MLRVWPSGAHNRLLWCENGAKNVRGWWEFVYREVVLGLRPARTGHPRGVPCIRCNAGYSGSCELCEVSICENTENARKR